MSEKDEWSPISNLLVKSGVATYMFYIQNNFIFLEFIYFVWITNVCIHENSSFVRVIWQVLIRNKGLKHSSLLTQYLDSGFVKMQNDCVFESRNKFIGGDRTLSATKLGEI